MSALGVLLSLGRGETRLQSRYGIANYLYSSGRVISFPVILFTPQAKAGPAIDINVQRIRLRLTLHLAILGSSMSWSSHAPFFRVFPLFGLRRRF